MINRPITPTAAKAVLWAFASGLFAWTLGNPLPAIAHGVQLTHQTLEAVEVQALYDNGDPISNAQITVYAPTDPETPWQQGTADKNGRFLFAPDPSLPGNWAVRVRQAGHGAILNVAIASEPDPEAAVAPPNATSVPEVAPTSGFLSSRRPSVNPLPTALAIASGVWGFVGTALFFSRFNGNGRGGPRKEEDSVA
ncbi:carboxypeptidase-like regulatory domain-containing protein [Laspinema olomoucense]|uniref:Carboxypeptidase-like regulatory domain-containing protein n=1 Tax=Laspinema olomoucense D3b TaxID=2953688 RepID=A0ABT2NCJ4_9CYAN|nr:MULTISPECIES: carboxypeptidase-like regulatory domain-containing protein [unclassified Laspinema]MCT7980206.1 carboxypeptidase-like regulatory domain-containing protein [Laspinema sp. D3b]MCT7988351.1 carboxypeptidase-like regulatory domain-containing protein [Laspinema sp. D3a]MCT7996662.1 carboxypeptidase-like regulatory domain-containing protein [Laspinema sp. D3c]